jgi:Domain of unknown function (DUF4397)/Bacterial Ig-like domain (group 3)
MTTQAARRLMIALTILGVVSLSAGVTFSLVQRASASAFDVCAATSPYAPCTYTTIQAAINDPTGPNPILVAPGTYHETINITRNVGVFGPNYLFNPVVGGRGPEAIIDASGVGPIAVTVSAASTAIEGFTITGAHGNSGHIESAAIVGPSGINSVLVENNIIKDNYNGIYELGGTSVTITQNIIRNNSAEQFGDTCFSGAPYCNAIFDGAAFGALNVIGNKIDETGGLAQFINHFQRAMSIDPTPAGTLIVDSNTLFNSSTLGNLTGSFTNNKISGDFGVRLVGGVNNFVIDSNSFSGLFSNAIISQKSFGPTGNSNLTITNNAVKQDLGDIQYAAGWVFNGSDDAAIDLDKLTGANNTIAENTIIYSGSNSFPNASVEAIRLRSGVTGTVTIDSNNFDGGNVGGPDTEALELDPNVSMSPTFNNSVTNNLMRDFSYGVNDLSTTPHPSTLGANNCISGNSLYGYSALASGATPIAEWWGSPLGPSPITPPIIGYGNSITLPNVLPFGFLTTPPQSACGGPVASNVQSNINPAPLNVPITVTAKLSTNPTSKAPVAAAYYTINSGAPQAITTTTTGSFGSSKVVDVSATLPGFTSLGTYTICVFGVDTYGQWGAMVQTKPQPKNCFIQTVNSANTTTTVTSNNNPSVFGQSVTFTVTVASGAGTPTGNVSLTDNGNPLAGPLALNGSGVATYTTSSLTIGTHPIVATYAGDASGTPIFNASTSTTLNQVVNKVGTSTTLTSAPNPSVSGQTVTISVKVLAADSSALTGSVVLKDGATTLGTVTLTNGAGSFSTSALSVGTHNITGAYSGDSTHDVSNGAASQTMNATPVVPTGSSNAYIRIAQSSESYATSDISIDGATTFPNVAACTVQPYYPITAGKHTFTVQSPSGGATIITETITLTAGQYYTLAVVGNSAKSITPALLVFEDNESVSSNQAKSRVYHLSDTLGPVQATAGSTTLAANLTFGSATSYTNQTPGTVTYSFQPSSGPALTDALNESANQVYSIFLMCNGQVTNTAATGVPVALPQTGYGSMPFWQNPFAARALLILGALLLLIGLGGFGSYLAFSRRRNLAI